MFEHQQETSENIPHKEAATQCATNNYARNVRTKCTNQAIALEQTRAHPIVALHSPQAHGQKLR